MRAWLYECVHAANTAAVDDTYQPANPQPATGCMYIYMHGM